MAESLKIIIEGVDRASRELRKVSSALGKMGGTATETQKSVFNLNKVMKLFGVTMGAMLVRRIVRGIWNLAQLGAQAERLEVSFARLADTQAPEMLEGLREASRGAISDMGLMQAANQAMMLGVTRDAKQLAQLMEVAIDRGRAMGLSAEQAFSDIVRGIGRMSPLILDNLGIIMDAEKTFADYAASIGKTTSELDSAEKRQALLNRVLQESVSIGDDTAASFEKQAAAIRNLKVAIGSAIAGVPAYEKGMEAVTGTIEVFIDVVERAGKSAPLIGMYETALEGAFEAERITGMEAVILMQELAKLDSQWQQGIISTEIFHSRAGRLNVVLSETSRRIKELSSYTDLWVLKLQWATTAEERLAQAEVEEAAAALEAADAKEAYFLSQMSLNEQYVHYAAKLSDVKISSKEFWAILLILDGITKELTADTEALTKATEAEAKALEKATAAKISTRARAGLRYALALREDNLKAQIRIWETEQRKHKENSDEWRRIEIELIRLRGQVAEEKLAIDKDYAQKAEKLQIKHLSELRSAVEGLLQPTGVTELDMARARLGTYTDQWDEYIRRVRSAATDAESAWKHLIPTEILVQGADAIKVWAAETEEAFYAGLVPEEINWEAFARDYEAFLTRKVGREAMIEEAMARVGAVRVDLEAFLGIAPDLAENTAQAAVAMKEIGDVSVPIGDFADSVPGLVVDFDTLEQKTEALIEMFKRLRGEVEQHLPVPGTSPSPGIPPMQAGTPYWRGGGAWVGEHGPEYVNLPVGSRVYSARESRGMGGDTITINIHAAGGPTYAIEGAVRRGILSARRARGLR